MEHGSSSRPITRMTYVMWEKGAYAWGHNQAIVNRMAGNMRKGPNAETSIDFLSP